MKLTDLLGLKRKNYPPLPFTDSEKGYDIIPLLQKANKDGYNELYDELDKIDLAELVDAVKVAKLYEKEGLYMLTPKAVATAIIQALRDGKILKEKK